MSLLNLFRHFRQLVRPAGVTTLVLTLLLVGTVARAQITTADILGTVTDASGAVLPSVRITAHNLDTAADYFATSDNLGSYVITLLPVGHYSIKAVATGFKTWTVPEVTLAIGDRLRQDVRLDVGSLEQSVEVTASSPALQADSSSVSNLITNDAMQNLPLNGRNFVVLTQLAAGAAEGDPNGLPSGTRPDDRRQTSAVTVNAQPTSYNNFLIDGMDDNERSIGTVLVKPSVDALQEMKVYTSLYSAEYGRTAGGVINFVTRSGVNEFHGSLFEFFRNEKLDARNFFAAVRGPFKQNQFGGSLGGPIMKNKLFFFGDYEGFRMHQGQTFTDSVPTSAERVGNFAGVAAIFDPLSTTTNANGVIHPLAISERPDPSRADGSRSAKSDRLIPIAPAGWTGKQLHVPAGQNAEQRHHGCAWGLQAFGFHDPVCPLFLEQHQYGAPAGLSNGVQWHQPGL